MASLGTTTIGGTADLVARGLKTMVEEELRKRLEPLAKEILRDVCAAAAKNLTHRVASFHNIQANEFVIDIRFNDEQVK